MVRVGLSSDCYITTRILLSTIMHSISYNNRYMGAKEKCNLQFKVLEKSLLKELQNWVSKEQFKDSASAPTLTVGKREGIAEEVDKDRRGVVE